MIKLIIVIAFCMFLCVADFSSIFMDDDTEHLLYSYDENDNDGNEDDNDGNEDDFGEVSPKDSLTEDGSVTSRSDTDKGVEIPSDMLMDVDSDIYGNIYGADTNFSQEASPSSVSRYRKSPMHDDNDVGTSIADSDDDVDTFRRRSSMSGGEPDFEELHRKLRDAGRERNADIYNEWNNQLGK